MLAFRPLERWVRRHSHLKNTSWSINEPYGEPKLKVPRAPGFLALSHMTFARRMTWQSKTRTSISNNSNRNLLVWTRPPSKSRRQKSRKWPAGTKMTAKTTIRAIGDNPEPIAGTTEFSATRANPRLTPASATPPPKVQTMLTRTTVIAFKPSNVRSHQRAPLLRASGALRC